MTRVPVTAMVTVWCCGWRHVFAKKKFCCAKQFVLCYQALWNWALLVSISNRLHYFANMAAANCEYETFTKKYFTSGLVCGGLISLKLEWTQKIIMSSAVISRSLQEKTWIPRGQYWAVIILSECVWGTPNFQENRPTQFIKGKVYVSGLYASFLQGHQGNFSLVKGTLWGNVNFYWNISRASRQWRGGMEAITFVEWRQPPLLPSCEVSGLTFGNHY